VALATRAKALGQSTVRLAPPAMQPGADVDARELHHTFPGVVKQEGHRSKDGVGTHEPEAPAEHQFCWVGMHDAQMGLGGQAAGTHAGLTPKLPPVITTTLPPTVGPLRSGNLDMVEGSTRVLVDTPDTV